MTLSCGTLSLVFVLALLAPLVAPLDLSVERQGELAVLTWTDANTAVDGYWVYRDNARHAFVPAGTLRYEDDIGDGRRHTYRVSALRGDDESPLSLEVNIRSTGAPDRLVYLGVPLLALIVVFALLADRHTRSLDKTMPEEEQDEPILLTDRLLKR